MSPVASPAHRWRFFRSGGLDQALIETEDDLRALEFLDQKLWVALSCPVRGLQLDERTLALIDTDKDGHVRPPEVLAAVGWACARLKDPASILKGPQALPLEAISDPALADAARWVLSRSAKAGDSVLASDAAAVAASLSQGPLKGDGALRPEAAPDEATRQLIRDITACLGQATGATIETFFSDLAAFTSWSASPAGAGIGPAAAAAFEAVSAVKAKVKDYFARASMASYDPSAAAGLNRSQDDMRAISGLVLSSDSPELAALPLARAEPGRPLPLTDGVNPAWAAAIARLRTSAVAPLLGERDALTEAEWDALNEKLRPYEAWSGTRPSSPVSALGAGRIAEILGGPGRKALADLLAEDAQLAPRVAAASDVERLALFIRDLGTLLRNFVNFSDFYSRARPAVFQAGTLYLDSRSCRLCIQVDDFAAHTPFAAMSRVYVAYIECRRAGDRKIRVAAAFTQGDSDYLFVGRNGVYYDRAGLDWDATIVSIADSPISIRQAFFTPYKRASAFVGEQISKFAASKDKAVQSAAGAAVTPGQPGAAQYFDIAKFAGIFAALGIAIGAIGVAIERIFSRLLGLPLWMWPVALAVALLIISGPSMILAAMKLRQRNLGPLLEGTGWAVNGRVKINMPLGAALTDRAALPEGSARLAHDPYVDTAANARRAAAVVIVLAAAGWLVTARILHLWPF
jgi:hypothetical protein